MTKNEKEIIFSDEVDGKISGFALVLSFLSVGIFLLLFPEYFGNKVTATIIRWIFISIGLIGLMVELSKNKSSNIKGVDNFLAGVGLVGLWAVLFTYINIWYVNVISFFILLVGLYGLYLGLIQIIYSAIQTVRNHKENKESVTTDIGVLLTKILSLILVIVQIIKALETK